MAADGNRPDSSPACPQVGMMAWRIGDVLDPQAQFDWIRTAGFDGVGFHAAAGSPGQWQGIDPGTCKALDRACLRERLTVFGVVEVHAPFALTLGSVAAADVVQGLVPVLEFAGQIGATVVTVHAEPPPPDRLDDGWRSALEHLDRLAAGQGLRIGLETTANFAAVTDLALPRVGITLDVGHMHHHGRAPLIPFGSLGGVVRHLGRGGLFHLHLHDVRAGRDHVEMGTGEVDMAGLFQALRGVRYERAFCLELNPDLVPPDGICRSLAAVRQAWHACSQA